MANNNNNNNNEEPSTAPEPDRWYNITLGPSLKDQRHSSPKFCTLRYEFKPASIDKNQPGTLHKSKNNRVNVEFQNNQHGKPKVTFEGVSEEYKDNDAVLFFDGETFRLERLHRAVKRLRHVRLPGESAAAAASTTLDSYSPPVVKVAKVQSLNKGTVHLVPAEVEQIDIGDSESLESKNGKDVENPSSLPNPSTASPDAKNYESEEHVDIVDDDDDVSRTAKMGTASEKKFTGLDIDINLPHQVDTDDEIADVDVSDVEADKGPNAAEALRAQVNAEGKGEQTSSSSTSSGSDSSGSGSGSASDSGSGSGTSSSDSESSDGGCGSVSSI